MSLWCRYGGELMSFLDVGAPWRLLSQRRDLRLLLAAGLVSMTGDWILGIGLTYSVYAITGSTLASAVTLLASFVPQVVAGSVAGVFVDRWDRKRTMVACNLLLAVGLVPLVLLDTFERIWVVYIVLVWESVIEVFFAPAEQAMLPRLVEDEELVTANALNSQNQQLSRLVGFGVGGNCCARGRNCCRRGRHHGGRRPRYADVRGRRRAGARHPYDRRCDQTRRRSDGARPARRAARRVDRGPSCRVDQPGRAGRARVPADHEYRRGHHGDALRAVRARRPAQRRADARRDHQRAGGRWDRRGLRGGQRGQRLVAGSDVRRGSRGVRGDRPGDLPLPVAAGLPVAGDRRHGPRRCSRRARRSRHDDAAATPHGGRPARSGLRPGVHGPVGGDGRPHDLRGIPR